MKHKIRLIITLFLLVLAGNATAEENLLKYNYQFPEFKFAKSKTDLISNQNLKGSYFIANFFFTSCPQVCPTKMGKIAHLQQEFKNTNLQFISLSVDPETDTFLELDKYSKRFKADLTRWHLLRPSKLKLDSLIEELKLAVGNQISEHSTRLILVNPTGQIYNYYQSSNNQDMQKLRRDLEKLL